MSPPSKVLVAGLKQYIFIYSIQTQNIIFPPSHSSGFDFPRGPGPLDFAVGS